MLIVLLYYPTLNKFLSYLILSYLNFMKHFANYKNIFLYLLVVFIYL